MFTKFSLVVFRSFGKLNISAVSLEGVAEEMEKQLDNLTESKGVKAHFRLDESGLLNLDNVTYSTLMSLTPLLSDWSFIISVCYRWR